MDTKTNQYDCRGRKQGLWTSPKEDIYRAACEANYVDGLRNGRYARRHSDGVLWFVTNCIDRSENETIFEGELVLLVRSGN